MLGRKTCLQRVEWRDGWLRLLAGGTKPQQQVELSSVRQVLECASHLALAREPTHEQSGGGPPPSKTLARPPRDDFNSDALDGRWSSLRVPVDESWLSLKERPNWLRLRGRDSTFSLFTQSLIARRVQHFDFVAETCLEFAPTHFTQMAGLICYYDTRQHCYLRVTHDENLGTILGITLTDDGVYDELAHTQIVINDWNQVFLRATVNEASLQFSAAPDGKTWRDLGPVLDFSKLSDDYGSTLRFTGAMIGLCAQDVGDTRAVADFDYFEYTPATA